MGGNTMHLHSVGLALLMGISLLHDPLPKQGPSARSNKFVKAQFVTPSPPAKRGMPQTTGINKQSRLS